MTAPAGTPESLLLVSYEYPPVQGPGVWRTLGLSRDLPRLGWRVTVLASDRSSWHDRTDPGLLDSIPDEVGIQRVRGVPFGARFSRWLPERPAGWLRRAFPNPLLLPVLKMVRRARRAVPPGRCFVLTSGPPHIVHLVGLALKRSRPCVWVADFRDPWMDEPVQAWKGRYQRRLGLRAERAVLGHADVVVSVSPTWHAALSARRPTRPTVLLPNASDLDPDHLPDPERPWSAGERVLLFPGTPQPGNTSLGLWEGIRLAAEAGLPDPVLRFAFMGLHADMHARARATGISHLIDDLGPQPRTRAVALMRGADVILVTVKSGPASRGVIPAKIYDAVALSKFVLLVADPDGDAAELLRPYQVGGVCDTTDPEAIARALRELALAPADRLRPSGPGPGPLAGWSRRVLAERFDEVLRRAGDHKA